MEEFFKVFWKATTGFEADRINDFLTPKQRSEYLYQCLLPALDLHIQKYQLPRELKPGESELGFFIRLVDKMYALNQEHKGCWSDSWPTTALELGRTNCAYGSLVLAKALNMAGFPMDTIEYATPGPLSHATIVIGGFYLDQANGVVVPAKETKSVGDIKCYVLDLSNQPLDVVQKVPFRLVPVHDVPTGVRSLISNLDPLIEDACSGNPEAVSLVKRFKIGMEKIYSRYAFIQLMPAGWERSELMSHAEWKAEYEESSKRISGVISS